MPFVEENSKTIRMINVGNTAPLVVESLLTSFVLLARSISETPRTNNFLYLAKVLVNYVNRLHPESKLMPSLKNNMSELEDYVHKHISPSDLFDVKIHATFAAENEHQLSTATTRLLDIDLPSDLLQQDSGYGQAQILKQTISPNRIAPGTTAEEYLHMIETIYLPNPATIHHSDLITKVAESTPKII